MLCHKQGIVHGDVAERNVLVTAAGKVFLIDFDHSIDEHQCPGVTQCWELVGACVDLDLVDTGPDDESDFSAVAQIRSVVILSACLAICVFFFS